MERGRTEQAPAPNAAAAEVAEQKITPPEQEQAEPETESISMSRRIKNGLIISYITLSALMGGIGSGQESKEARQHKADNIAGAAYRPWTDQRHLPSRKTADERADEVGDYYGRSVSVLPPDEKAEENFTALYYRDQRGPFQDTPQLRETVHILDRQLFKPENEAHPGIYPFEIYNASPYPLDLRFINYSIKATRHWLNDIIEEDGGNINIGGHTPAKVRPWAIPHLFTVMGETPNYLKNIWGGSTTGLTTYGDPNFNSSFIMKYGYGDDPGRRSAIATEVCQSMVNFEEGKTAITGTGEQHAMNSYVDSFNSTADSVLDIAGQESVCNGLGRVVMEAYEGGEEAIYQAFGEIPRVGLAQKPWIDPSLYVEQIPRFLELAQGNKNGFNTIFTVKNSSLPTVEWYSQHEGY